MPQLLCHLWGDYILQSDWMAQNKSKNSLPCAIHAFLYSATFLLLKPSWVAFSVIAGSHFIIDRFRLARYVIWAKNWMSPWGANLYWRNCSKTGYLDDDRLGPPAWMAVWLLIVADNILHLTLNSAALSYL
jgi:Protein of unknown function (DUF3307)